MAEILKFLAFFMRCGLGKHITYDKFGKSAQGGSKFEKNCNLRATRRDTGYVDVEWSEVFELPDMSALDTSKKLFFLFHFSIYPPVLP